MEKSKLQSFINRYYLAGNCEAVILKEQENSINCELIDMDQTVVGKIKWNTTPFMKGMLGAIPPLNELFNQAGMQLPDYLKGTNMNELKQIEEKE